MLQQVVCHFLVNLVITAPIFAKVVNKPAQRNKTPTPSLRTND